MGDIKHSRVARSNVLAFTALGAEVVLVAPPTLLPASLEGWPVTATGDLDAALGEVDVVYLLRIQAERLGEAAAARRSRSTTALRAHPRPGPALRRTRS